MKIVNVTQGSPEWHAYRATHFNASDAPAMMACSPHKTRDELIEEMATGIVKEVDAATQRRFDEGHRLEVLGRARAEEILGESLFPVVGESEKAPCFAASFDGLTMCEDIVFEHKTMNAALREALTNGADLPLAYLVQVQHQLMVCNAARALFMAGEEVDGAYTEMHVIIDRDPALQAQIIAGWNQLEKDVAARKAQIAAGLDTPRVAKPVGAAPEAAMALTLQVTGSVVACNVPEFKAHAIARIESIKRVLVTDQDFADAEESVKWCGDVEDRIKTVKSAAIAQQATVEEAFRALDDVNELLKRTRLDLKKLIDAEKLNRRSDIANKAMNVLAEHIAALNCRFFPAMPTDFHAPMKGLKTLESCQSKVNDALAQAKIKADAIAAGINANLAHYASASTGFTALFPDLSALVLKAAEDFQNTVSARIARHKDELAAAEQRKAQEAKDRAEREAAAQAKAAVTAIAQMPPPAQPVQQVVRSDSAPTLNLGTIQKRLGLPISADFLATLGIKHAATQGAAKLYHEAAFPLICDALVKHIYAAKHIGTRDMSAVAA